MRVVETKVYMFDELSYQAKEKARDWFRQGIYGEDYYYEYIIDDAVRMAEILGITFKERTVRLLGGGTRGEPVVYFSGFSSQGDGASFEGSYKYKAGSAKIIRQEAPHDVELHGIADRLQDIQRRHFYRLHATITHRGHYYHSGCMAVDVWDDNDTYRDVGDAEEVVTEELRLFADWIYSQLESDYEYRMSDEAVDQELIDCEYEFTEDGERA